MTFLDHGKPSILLLSSSLLTDRILCYTRFLSTLATEANAKVWALSANQPQLPHVWANVPAIVEAFPSVRPFKEFPYNFPLRRLNDLAWDFKLQPPSRLSILQNLKFPKWPWYYHLLKCPARLIALMGFEQGFESWLQRILLRYKRSPEARRRMLLDLPAVLVSLRPHFYEEPAVVAEAKRLGVPVLAFITSWDNISTKNRLVNKYDGFLVWSEQMKADLEYFYPYSRDVPIYVTGAPQFDVFFERRFYLTRAAFCERHCLDPTLPIIVYALGSPNFLPGEWYGAYYLAERVKEGALGKVQLLLRPHPLFDTGTLKETFEHFKPFVSVQATGKPLLPVSRRYQDERDVIDWVNTVRYADVVVTCASTFAIEACICDKPVVNLDFDPSPGQLNQRLVREVNHVWSHFRPVAESGGLRGVGSLGEMVEAVKTYLKNPDLNREGRRWVAEFVCGRLDGRCGERLGMAVLDFLRRQMRGTNAG